MVNDLINIRSCKDNALSVKKVKLVNDGGYGYALDITWTVETPERIEEIHIPRVSLPISADVIQLYESSDFVYGGKNYAVNMGFGKLPVRTINGVAYTITTVKEKTQEMTLEEIERKLGHKVKIVTKEMK